MEKLYGKIIKEDSNKVYTNFQENGFAWKKRIGITWDPVNYSRNNSVNIKEENNSVNIKNINGIDPASIKKNNSSRLKIYKLEALPNNNTYYDKYDSFVISAYTELQARRIAQFNGGYEIYKILKNGFKSSKKIPFWTNNKLSSCELLDTNNMSIGVVCGSFNAG